MNVPIVVTEEDAKSLLGMLKAVKVSAEATGFPGIIKLNKEADRLTEMLSSQLEFNNIL
jgi:hypothetical protein